MLKLFLLLLGLAGGAAGAVAWLLSEPGAGAAPQPAGTDSLSERLKLLRTRLDEAMAAGKRAGDETENRARHDFETWRLHPDRPNTSR